MQRRQVDVIVAGAVEYRGKVERAGLAFRPVRPGFDDMQRLLAMNRAQLTQAVLRRADFLFRRLVVPGARVSYEDMLEIVEGADLVLTSSLAVGARLAAERCAVPWIAIVLQPMMFLSAFDPPVLPKVEWLTAVLRWLGPAATGGFLKIVRHGVGRMVRPIGALRRELGLPESGTDVIFEGQFSSGGAIGLYSQLLGGIQPDYPRPTYIAGFASFDSEDGAPAVLDFGLRAFLDAGPAPLVFTLGSLIVNSPGTFFQKSLAAARLLGKRAVLLVGVEAASHNSIAPAADVYVAAYAPHGLLFSRAEVVVHQAGIGTLAQALRSGRPQLIVPFYGDQSDNAARAVRLGVARSLRPRRYTAARAARELALLVAVDEYRSRAAEVRNALAGENGAARAAGIVLEKLLSASPERGVVQ